MVRCMTSLSKWSQQVTSSCIASQANTPCLFEFESFYLIYSIFSETVFDLQWNRIWSSVKLYLICTFSIETTSMFTCSDGFHCHKSYRNENTLFPCCTVMNYCLSNFIQKQYMQAKVVFQFLSQNSRTFFFGFPMCEFVAQPWCSTLMVVRRPRTHTWILQKRKKKQKRDVWSPIQTDEKDAERTASSSTLMHVLTKDAIGSF
jgi:hypothetical protein